jgi:hypothetical protein
VIILEIKVILSHLSGIVRAFLCRATEHKQAGEISKTSRAMLAQGLALKWFQDGGGNCVELRSDFNGNPLVLLPSG